MPLPKEEEARLVREAKEGADQSLEKLVLEHLGLVKSIARKLCNPESNPELFDQLVQEGSIAFIEAIDLFDPDKSVRLATYAFLGINGAMLDYIEKQHWSGMNIPRPLRDLARKVERVHDKLMQKYHRKPIKEEIAKAAPVYDKLKKSLKREPTVEEIVKAMSEPIEKLEDEKVEEALNLLALDIVSLEALSEPTEEGKSAWEPISEERLPEELVIDKVEIEAALRKLTPNRRKAIELRYWDDLSLKEIGAIMGRTENAVKQLLHNAMKDLEEHLKGYFADNSDGGDYDV